MFRRLLILLLLSVMAVMLTAGGAWAGAYEQGMTWFKKGQFKSAAEQFEAVLKDDPDNAEAAKRLGDCYFNLYSEEKPEYAVKSIKAYQKALKEDPNDGNTRLRMAKMYAWSGDSDAAIKELNILLDKEPSNTKAMFELATIYSWKPETFADSLKQLQNLFKVDPKNKEGHLLAGRVYSWKGDHDSAIIHYEKLLGQDPENDEVRMEYANELTLAGRFDEAVMQFNYLTNRKKLRDQSLIGLAEAYYYSKRYRDASAVVQLILQKDPKNARAWRLQGLIYAEQKRINEAVEAFLKAIELNPDDSELRVFLARAYAMNEMTYPEAIKHYEEALKSQPDNAEIRAELARFYIYSNNYTKANEQYVYLIKRNPKDVRLRADYVRIHLKGKQYDKAVEECKNLLQLEPDNIDSRLLYGEVLIQAGMYDEALDVYDDILDDKSYYLPAMIGKAMVHNEISLAKLSYGKKLEEKIKGQTLGVFNRIRWLFARMSEMWHFNKAVSLLTDAAKKYPDAVDPRLRLAEVYSQHLAYDKAIEQYREAVRINPNSTDAYLGMAWVYGKMGNQEKSIDAIRHAAQLDPTNVEILTGLGDAYSYQEDIDQAIETLEKALILRYSDLDLHRRLAHLYSQSRRYYGKCVTECMYILEQDPSDVEIRLLLARVYSWMERYDDALPIYERLLTERPDDRDLYLEMMRTKVYSGRSNEVIEELRAKLSKDPGDIDARLALAQAYDIRNDLDLAEKEFRTVLKKEPSNSLAHLGLGDVYRQQEEYDKAVVEYREVLQMNPNSPESYYGLGVIDRKHGNYERAISMQKKVLEMDPGNIHAIAELSYDHYLLSRRYIAHSGQYHRAWWLLTNGWGSLYGIFGEYPSNVEQMRAILAEDPGNCDLRYMLAQELSDHNRKNEAVEEYRKIIKYCPNHIGSRIALADIYATKPATYAYAIQETLEIIKQEPDNFEARLRLARLYAWSIRYNAAIEQYAWCLKAKPDSVDIRYELAQVLSYAKRYNEAIVQYEIILGQDPNRDDVRLMLAQMFAYSNRIDQAIREYEVILNHDPNNYEASMALARLYGYDRRYYQRATDLYRKLLIHYPSQHEARVEYGRLLFERGEFGDAEKAYRDMVELDPNDAEAHVMLGRIYVAQREPEMAKKEFKEALLTKPDMVDAHYYLAELYAADPDTYDLAIKEGHEVLKYEPGNEDVRELVARVYASNEQYYEAAGQYKILLESKPNDTGYQTEYAMNLSYAEQFDEAIEVFNMLVEKNPNDSKIRLELGMAHLAKGNYFDAIANLEYAVESQPWNVRARKGLARAYDKSGQAEQAIKEYKRILIINPDDQEAKDYLNNYNIEYIESAFLDEWFDYPGKDTKTVIAMGAVSPAGSLEMNEVDQAIFNHKVRMAEQMMIHQRLKRARYLYEELVKKKPNDPYLHFTLGQIYHQLGMWDAAKKEYEIVRKMRPDNQDVVVAMEKLKYDSSPSITGFVGVKVSQRNPGNITHLYGGSRFIYRFWNQSEAFGEVAAGRYFQDEEVTVVHVSPRLGLKVGLFGELTLSGEYTYNQFFVNEDVEPTHNYRAGAQTNIFDYVGLEAYYYRDDVRQTISAMEEGIGGDNVGGALGIYPIERLRLRGEYRHTWYNGSIDSDYVPHDSSDFASGGASYTVFDNPFFTFGYVYSMLMFDNQQPGRQAVYWTPEFYQNHAIPLDVSGSELNGDMYYSVGVVPSYNINSDADDSFGLSLYGGFDWEVALAHKLGANMGASWGLGPAFYEYSALLSYTYIFGKHTGSWK